MRRILIGALLCLFSAASWANEPGHGYNPVAHFGETTPQGGTLDIELMSNVVENCWGQRSRIGTLATTRHTGPNYLKGCWRVDAGEVVMIIQDPVSMETSMLTFPISKFSTMQGFEGWSNP